MGVAEEPAPLPDAVRQRRARGRRRRSLGLGGCSGCPTGCCRLAPLVAAEHNVQDENELGHEPGAVFVEDI